VKLALFLPPAVALVIGGGFIGAQRQTISKLERESDVLRKHIATANELPSAPVTPGITPREAPKADPDAIDWEEMAEVFGGMARGSGTMDMRKMMSFQSRLQKMDKDELAAALDQITALKLADEERMMLQAMLLGPLATKDPEFALTRFSKHLGDEANGMGWQLASALGQWAKKDAAAATAWFEKEIATGTFDSKSLDGKNRVRTTFESNLVSQLLSVDPVAAEARVAALPANQRKEVLGGFGFGQLKEADQVAFAALVRGQVSEKERIEIFGETASNAASHGSLKDASEFLDRIAATPVERVKAAEKAALGSIQSRGFKGKTGAEDIDTMRGWLSAEAPGSVDRVTGESIGNLASSGNGSFGGGMKYDEAAQLALKYHESSGNDDVLTGFLEEAGTYGNKEGARSLAEKISDPKKREDALKNLE